MVWLVPVCKLFFWVSFPPMIEVYYVSFAKLYFLFFQLLIKSWPWSYMCKISCKIPKQFLKWVEIKSSVLETQLPLGWNILRSTQLCVYGDIKLCQRRICPCGGCGRRIWVPGYGLFLRIMWNMLASCIHETKGVQRHLCPSRGISHLIAIAVQFWQAALLASWFLLHLSGVVGFLPKVS